MKVNRAIVSILFTIGEQKQGDMFFNNLGINRYNINQDKKMNFPKENSEVDNHLTIPGSYGHGFNYNAIEGLLNLINMESNQTFTAKKPPRLSQELKLVDFSVNKTAHKSRKSSSFLPLSNYKIASSPAS